VRDDRRLDETGCIESDRFECCSSADGLFMSEAASRCNPKYICIIPAVETSVLSSRRIPIPCYRCFGFARSGPMVGSVKARALELVVTQPQVWNRMVLAVGSCNGRSWGWLRPASKGLPATRLCLFVCFNCSWVQTTSSPTRCSFVCRLSWPVLLSSVGPTSLW